MLFLIRRYILRAVATCGFGLESILSFELKKVGASSVQVTDGRVFFDCDEDILARANVWTSVAERILIVLGEFKVETFDDLFDGISGIYWGEYIGKNDMFPVKGYTMNSKLSSVPACQSVIKKAIVEKLKKDHGCVFLPERGDVKVRVRFSIVKDICTVMIDTSGDGLHKRGYRPLLTEAPIKETIAAGIADLARVFPDSKVADPFCGSGTLVIESAIRAMGMAPGASRQFAGEDYPFLSDAFREAKAAAAVPLHPDCTFEGRGYDIDPHSVEAARSNAERAGVAGCCSFEVADAKNFRAREDEIVMINPPYGERLMDPVEAQKVMKEFHGAIERSFPKSLYIITADQELEDIFGKANRRRKLYNGMIQCTLYMYFGERA